MSSHPKTDEIDIIDLSVKFIRFVRKNIVWIILFPLLGAIGGVLYNISKGPTFEASLLLRSKMMVEDELRFMLQNYHLETDAPGLTDEERSQIRRVDIVTSKKDPYAYCFINCLVTDTTILSKMAAGIKSKLEHDPHVNYTVKNAKDLAKTMIEEYTASIDKAESLIEHPQSVTSTNYTALRTLPEIMELYNSREMLIIAQRDSTGIQVVSGFHPEKIRSTTLKRVGLGLVGGTLLCICFLMFAFLAPHIKQAAR